MEPSKKVFQADKILFYFARLLQCFDQLTRTNTPCNPFALGRSNVIMATTLKILNTNNEMVILEGKKDTCYIGPPEKAAEFFQSLVYRRAIAQQIQQCGIGTYKALQLEIKHKCSKNENK